MNKFTALSLAAAVAGAVSMSALVAPALSADGVKCFGITKAGENDCANAAGTHSCKGQSTADYDGGEWKTVANADECTAAKGQLEAFEGMNTMISG